MGEMGHTNLETATHNEKAQSVLSTLCCKETQTKMKTKVSYMKNFLVLALVGLCACESPAEISAREQLDAACVAGNLDACVAVQNRVTAEGQNLAITLAGVD